MLLGSWRRRRAHILVRDLRSKLDIEYADLAGEQYEMQQHISMHDQKQERSEYEEPRQRQVDAEEQQSDRALERAGRGA
jgi:hypothetical protein